MSANAMKRAEETPVLGPSGPHMPTLNRLVEMVEVQSHLPKNALYEKTRRISISHARHIAFYLACKRTRFSTTQIGGHWGMDHTSVIYGRDRIKEAIENGDEHITKFVAHIEAKIGSPQ